MSRQDKIEEIERLVKGKIKGRHHFFNTVKLSMEVLKNILTPQDYEEALLQIPPEEADRLIKK